MKNEKKQENTKTNVQPKVRAKAKVVDENPIVILSKESKEQPFSETIEKERKGLFALYKKTSRFSTLIMIIVVVVFVTAFAVFSQPGWGQPVCWTLVGLTIAGLIVYFIFNRNLYPNASKNYFKVFWKETNDYLFNAPEFSECKIDTKERYVLPEVICDRVYRNVIDSASRNIVKGLYKGKGFVFGELAYYIAGPKKNSKDVLFVGRHLSLENNLHFEGRYIINIRSDKPMDLPNDIDDLKVLYEQNQFVIYGPEGADYMKDLGKDLIEDLKSINCAGNLLNVNVAVWGGHTSAYLSFDDTIAAIPFEKEIDVAAYENLRKVILNVFQILESK